MKILLTRLRRWRRAKTMKGGKPEPLSGNNLVRFLSVQLCLFHNFCLLKIIKHTLDRGFVLNAEVTDYLLEGFNAIWSLSEIGYKV